MRAVLALALILLFAAPSWGTVDFPLSRYRLDLWRDKQATTTVARYLASEPRAVAATAAGFSDRRGMPIGLLMLDGVVRQGNYRKRCFLQFDRSGRRAEIGYALRPWVWDAFAAGPCIVTWASHGRSGVYVAWREERFSRAFVTADAERSVLCLDRARIAILRFRGPLFRVAPQMLSRGFTRCINLEGGSALNPNAVQPAVLGIIDTQD